MPKRSKQCCQNYCEELSEEVYHAGVVLQNVLQQLSDFSSVDQSRARVDKRTDFQ